MSYDSLYKLYYSNNSNYQEIYNQRFNSADTIKLDFYIANNQAFYVQTPQLFKNIIAIEKLDKDILKISNKLPKSALKQFARRSLIDEIVLTNNIEGVYSTRHEIFNTLNEVDKNNRNRFHGLVSKYNMLSNNKITINSCQDIREIYDELVLDEIIKDDPKNIPDGKIFRKSSVSVYNAAQKEIHRGLHPEANIIDAMEKAIKILEDDKLLLIIRIALFHYMFGYIHPFYEGNGRTSRYISSALLANEYEKIIGYRLSYTIKENVSKYYESFKICNHQKNLGDLTPFILMFLSILKTSFGQLKEALTKRLDKLNLYKTYIPRLPNGDNNKYYRLYLLLLQATLFSEAGMSISELSDLCEISPQTLKKRLDTIKNLNLVICKKINKKNYFHLNLEQLEHQ